MSGGSKRSKTINLVLMPTALLFGVLPLLDACKKHVPEQDISDKSDSIPSAPVPVADTPEPSSSVGDMFTSVDQCKAARVDPDDPNSDPLYPPEECDRANAEALAQHVQNAPKFTTLAECESQFGPSACTPAPVAVIPGQTVVVQQQSSGFMPFMTGYMLGSLGGGGHYHTTSVYYPAGSWRSSSDTRALVPSGGFGYSSATASRPIGYVARSSTALSPIGGFGSRSTVLAPTATGAPPAASAFRSAVSPRAMLVAPSARSSSFGTMTAPSSRGGFGMSAGSHSSGFGGAHSGIST